MPKLKAEEDRSQLGKDSGLEGWTFQAEGMPRRIPDRHLGGGDCRPIEE
jgi:hypothetical protein